MQDFYLDSEFARKVKIRYTRKPNFDKKGVMVAIVEDDIVEIGFSMCHRIDKWDFVKGQHIRNFGLSVALERAVVWFGKAYGGGYHNTVEIPQTIATELKTFIMRLQEKYPEKQFPYWAKDFIECSCKEREEI